MELMSTFVGCRYILLVSRCRGYFWATSECFFFCEKCCKLKLSVQQSQNYWLNFEMPIIPLVTWIFADQKGSLNNNKCIHAIYKQVLRGEPLSFSCDDRGACCAFTQKICSETTDSWNSEETVLYTYDHLPRTIVNENSSLVVCIHPLENQTHLFTGFFSQTAMLLRFCVSCYIFSCSQSHGVYLLTPLKMVVKPHLWRALNDVV